MRKMTQILDVPFDALTMAEAVEKVMGFLADGKQHYICTPNPEIVMEAQQDKELMKILREADLVVPDGIGVVWASRYSEILLTERVAGYDLTQNIFSRIAGKNETVYFFGGAPGVVSNAARQMKKVYPGLKIVGGHNGYFDAEEEKKIIRQNITGEKIEVRPILKATDIMEARKVVRQVYLDEKIEQYIADIVFATRFPEKYDLKELKDMIGFGGSPRASINLALAARSYAFIKRRGYVIPEDVRAVAHDVLRHRIGLTYEAEASNMTSDEIVSKILNKVEVP